VASIEIQWALLLGCRCRPCKSRRKAAAAAAATTVAAGACANCGCTAHGTLLVRRGPGGVCLLCNACVLWYARCGAMRPVVVDDADGHVQGGDEGGSGTPLALYDDVDGDIVPDQGGAPLPVPLEPPPMIEPSPPPPPPPQPSPPERSGPAAAAAASTIALALGPLRQGLPDIFSPRHRMTTNLINEGFKLRPRTFQAISARLYATARHVVPDLLGHHHARQGEALQAGPRLNPGSTQVEPRLNPSLTQI